MSISGEVKDFLVRKLRKRKKMINVINILTKGAAERGEESKKCLVLITKNND
jgi:hypothetical protein